MRIKKYLVAIKIYCPNQRNQILVVSTKTDSDHEFEIFGRKTRFFIKFGGDNKTFLLAAQLMNLNLNLCIHNIQLYCLQNSGRDVL